MDVLIETRLTGATAQEIEADVTVPIEDALRAMPGFVDVVSESRPEVSLVSVVIADRRPASVPGAVQQRLWDLRSRLPQGALPAIKRPRRKSTILLRDLSGSDTQTLAALAQAAAEAVGNVPGVIDASPIWTDPVVRRVRLDGARLAARGIATSDALAALRARGAFAFPAQDLRLVPIGEGGPPLSAVGDVTESHEPIRSVLLRNGVEDITGVSVEAAQGVPDEVFFRAISSAVPSFTGVFSLCNDSVRLELREGGDFDATVAAAKTLASVSGDHVLLVERSSRPSVRVCSTDGNGYTSDINTRGGPLRRRPGYSGHTVRFAITGPDLHELERQSSRLSRVADLPFVSGISTSPTFSDETRMTIDRAQASALGIDASLILDVLEATRDRGVIIGAAPGGVLVVASVDDAERASVRGGAGTITPIPKLVSISRERGPESIRRLDGARAAVVLAEVDTQDSLALVVEAVEQELAARPLPIGYHLDIEPKSPAQPEPWKPREVVERIVAVSLLVAALIAVGTIWNQRRRRRLEAHLEELARLRTKIFG